MVRGAEEEEMMHRHAFQWATLSNPFITLDEIFRGLDPAAFSYCPICKRVPTSFIGPEPQEHEDPDFPLDDDTEETLPVQDL
jgi:hypothetical protein